MGPRREQPHGQAASRVGVGGVVPAERRGHFLDVTHEVRVEWLAAGTDLLAGMEQVATSDLDRVEPDPTRHLVHLELAHPLDVGCPEGAVGAGGGGVGVHAQRIDTHRLPAIWAWGRVAAGGGHAWPVVGIGAGVEGDGRVPGEQAPVAGGGRAHVDARAVSPGRDHRLRDAVDDPDRTTGLARERDRDGLHLGVGLAAEAAAQVGDHDAHPAQGQVEQRGDLGTHQERVLAGGPQGHPAVLPRGDDAVGLHGVLVDAGKV